MVARWHATRQRGTHGGRGAGEHSEEPQAQNTPGTPHHRDQYRYNGEGFTYDRRRHLLVIDAASGETRQITQGDWDDTQPAWSPDSRRLAFVSAMPTATTTTLRTSLWWTPRAANRYGSRPAMASVRCQPGRRTDGASPILAMLTLRTPPATAVCGWSRPQADAPLSDRALDRDLEITETAAPIWQADGSAIVVGVQDRGSVGVIQVQVADGTVLPLVHGKRSVTSYSVANATLAFTAAEPHRPAEVYVRTALGEQQVTALNADWCATVELPEPEHFIVHSDGGEIDAWVMRPAGFEPGQRYPTLVNIHGGPFAQYGWTFFDEFQVQAGAGYAVLCCNPRGSSGREDAFARAIIGCPGEPDSADVLAMLDEALQRYDFLDPGRVGLIGGSYGGYLAGWIVGHTDRFVAAVPERGLYNRYSKDGTSDIWSGYTYLRVHQWENPELYWRYSPIAYVQNIRTPLLILHSEEDLRCPIEQAEQLFTALKQMRREVRFVRFPGENHELSRSGKPSHRVQRFGYILDWFTEKLCWRGLPVDISQL